MSKPFSFFGYGISRFNKRREISEKYNLPFDSVLDLSSGANLFVPRDYIQSLVIKEIKSFDPRDYYSINFWEYIEELARFLDVSADYFYPGINHIQLIYRLLSYFCNTGDKIALFQPEINIFYYMAQKLELNAHRIPLSKDFSMNVDQIIKTINNIKPKVILLSSPHYPTANQFPEKDILRLAENITSLIVIDESYVEFGKYSLVNQIPYFDNIAVVRTFSKAWGLGAFSSAYLVANPEIISNLKKWFFIEEIPPLHALITKRILQSPYRFVERINAFIKERKRVIENLQMMNALKVHKSDTNFLFIKFRSSVSKLYERFCSKGIIIKTFMDDNTIAENEKYFLVTLGTPQINDRFIIALAEIIETAT